MEEDGAPGTCPSCAAPHSRGALYCWQCGATLMERRRASAARRPQRRWTPAPRAPSARRGEHAASSDAGRAAALQRSALLPGVRRARRRAQRTAGGAAGARRRTISRDADGVRRGHRRHGRQRRPARRRRARWRAATPARGCPRRSCRRWLLAVFLGFGVLLGGAAGSRVEDTLAVGALAPEGGAPERRAPAAPAAGAPASTAAASEATAGVRTRSDPGTGAGATGTDPGRPSGASTTPASTGSAPAGEPDGAKSSTPKPSAPAPATKLPPVKHVFVIMLSDQPYAARLRPGLRGALPVGHARAPGRAARALLRGRPRGARERDRADQRPGADPATAAELPDLHRHRAGRAPAPTNRCSGSGCVYPAATQTLAGQLSAKHLTWRAYVEGIDEAARRRARAPTRRSGRPTRRSAQTASAGPYATFRNPFVYFHSIIASPACADRRRRPGAAEGRPGQPERRRASPTSCPTAATTATRRRARRGPGGAGRRRRLPADGRPRDPGSKAYKQGGLLVITVDEAPSSGEFADSSSCCGQPRFPNLPATTAGRLAPRRRHGRRAAALAVRQGRDDQPGTVQPLLAAAHDRGPVRPQAPRLRRPLGGQAVRTLGVLGRQGLSRRLRRGPARRRRARRR